MSLRSTMIQTARAARTVAPRAQIIPRRSASTAHKGSSNTPWMLGSAAVFGSLTAFILMPSGQDAAHGVHEHIDAKGAGAHNSGPDNKPEHEGEAHDNARELVRKERASGDRAMPDEDPKGKMVHAGEDRARTEIPSKRDDAKPMSRGASTGDNFDGTVDNKHMTGGVNNEGAKPDEQKKY